MDDKILCLNGKKFTLNVPVTMGILNLTPDSFSDGGQFTSIDSATRRFKEMVDEGAQIIDIGAESTRPGAKLITVEEELDRLLPLLKEIPKDQVILSIDTNKPEVQRIMLEEGVHMINDIMGGTPDLYRLAERYQAALVLMHTSAIPEKMQTQTGYGDITEELIQYFEKKSTELAAFDIPAIWMDPGIGFGKKLNHNLTLMQEIDQFTAKGWPMLIGSSRKSWAGELYEAPVDERLGASLGSIVMAYLKGAEIFRVHDVRESVQALDIAKRLR